MSESFDAYRVWLGIPPESRPPTYYELLGISPNEHEQAVIEAAVLRQSGYVRNFQIGKYAKDAARILNEIAAAKACLLDPAKRAEYDAGLRVGAPVAARRSIQPSAPYALASVMPEIDINQLAPAEPRTPRLPTSGQPSAAWPLRAPRRGGAALKRSAVPWQLVAGVGIGLAIAVAMSAIWPAREGPSDQETDNRVVLAGSPNSEETVAATTVTTVAAAEPSPSAHMVEAPSPEILQATTEAQYPNNVARCEGRLFFVGLEGDGWGAVGYELKNAKTVRFELTTVRPGDTDFIGFLVDFHTPSGYSHRLALRLGESDNQCPAPRWGRGARADRLVDLSQEFRFNEKKYLEDYPDIAALIPKGVFSSGQEHWHRHGKYEGRHAIFGSTAAHELNLADWSPPDWDQRAWFSIAATRQGGRIEGRLYEPPPPPDERLPGEFRRLTGHTDSVASLAFLPDCRLMSGGFDMTWAVWEVRAGIGMRRFFRLGHESAVRAVAVAPNAQSALVSNGNRILHVELPSGNVTKMWDASADGVRCLRFCPDGQRAISGGYDYKVRLWDVGSKTQVWERTLPGWVRDVDVSRDGSLILAATSNTDAPIRLFDPDGNEVGSLRAGNACYGLSLSPDARRCLAGISGDRTAIAFFDIESRKELARFEVRNWEKPVFSPDGHFAAWAGDKAIELWDMKRLTKIADFEHAPVGALKYRKNHDDMLPVAFSPDGTLLASGADDGTIYLWNMPDGIEWDVGAPLHIASANGTTLEKLDDNSILASGECPELETYTAVFETLSTDIDAIRLEALVHPSLPNNGPGRLPDGNFVLSEFEAEVAGSNPDRPPENVKFASAAADHSQGGLPITDAIDGKSTTGWAICCCPVSEQNINRTAIFRLATHPAVPGPVRWTIKLKHEWASRHALGRFRISFGRMKQR